METKTIPLNLIQFDTDFQARVKMDSDTVQEYADAMQDGTEFPPVVVFTEGDGKLYYLADGYHRVAAALKLERSIITAEVHKGNRRDAMLHAVGANARHGLRRSNADKRRAVEMLLRDDEWRKWSDREIGRQAAVSHKTVSKVRAELEASGEIPQTTERIKADGKVIDTKNVGSNQPTTTMNGGVERLNQKWLDTHYSNIEKWDKLHRLLDEHFAEALVIIDVSPYGYLYLGKGAVCEEIIEQVIFGKRHWYRNTHQGAALLFESILLLEKLRKDFADRVIVYKNDDDDLRWFVSTTVRHAKARDAKPNAEAQTFQPYDLVKTRTGRLGIVHGVNGRLIRVHTKNDAKAHYPNNLELIERPQKVDYDTITGFFERIGFDESDYHTLLTRFDLSHLTWGRDDLPLGSRIKILRGRADDGAQHRGVMVARKLVEAGLWDGIGELWFDDAYKIHEMTSIGHIAIEQLHIREQEGLGLVVSLPVELPTRQIEFLQALADGQPITRNAATRRALRGHGYITDHDEWDEIELTDAGRVALAQHQENARGFKVGDRVDGKHINKGHGTIRELQRGGREALVAWDDEAPLMTKHTVAFLQKLTSDAPAQPSSSDEDAKWQVSPTAREMLRDVWKGNDLSKYNGATRHALINKGYLVTVPGGEHIIRDRGWELLGFDQPPTGHIDIGARVYIEEMVTGRKQPGTLKGYTYDANGEDVRAIVHLDEGRYQVPMAGFVRVLIEEEEAVQGDLDECLIDAMGELIGWLDYQPADYPAHQILDHINFLLEALPELRQHIEHQQRESA